MSQAKMKLDLWINSESRDEIVTVGEFGWVWCEWGETLRAGPGPEFGNADPLGVVVAKLGADEMWHRLGAFATGDPKLDNFTDWDVQIVQEGA
jgi:hypothetical protein